MVREGNSEVGGEGHGGARRALMRLAIDLHFSISFQPSDGRSRA